MFIWKNIVTRFGVPNVLISDNGFRFDSKAFRKYCSDLGIKNRYSTPAYPQGNGQAETVNKVIVNRLKKRLDDAKRMGGRAITHPLDISDYTSQVNKEDPLLNDLWSRNYDSFGDWIPNTENELFHSEQQ